MEVKQSWGLENLWSINLEKPFAMMSLNYTPSPDNARK